MARSLIPKAEWPASPGRFGLTSLFGQAEQGSMRLMTLTIARWIAITGQLFTILFVQFSIGIDLPLLTLLPAVLASAVLNVALTLEFPATARLGQRGAVLLFVFDILQLGYLLLLTGGLNNPFSPLIVLPAALAATSLARLPTVFVTGFSIIVITSLALTPWALPWFGGEYRLPNAFIVAEWAAFCLSASLLSGYAYHLAEQARLRAAALNAAQLALAREQQLSALGSQAAAAAHLLGSPLATINVVSKDLLIDVHEDDPIRPEIEILLSEAKRCRDILAEFGKKPDDSLRDQPFDRAPITAHIQHLADQFPRLQMALRLNKEIVPGFQEPVVNLTAEIRHGLNNLIDNALQFAENEVIITWRSDHEGHRLIIEDDGPGFPPEVLDWLGEPFLSSRKGQGGLGLGVFIAITLLERSRAKLRFTNTGQGARVVVMWLPGGLEAATMEVIE